MARVNRSNGSVRRNSRRRKQQVQRLSNKKIQGFKELAAIIQKAVDTYWDPRTERFTGSLWADIHIGLRPQSGSVYYSLPPRILRSIGIRRVLLDPKEGIFSKDNREDKSTYPTALGGRVSSNAGPYLFDDEG